MRKSQHHRLLVYCLAPVLAHEAFAATYTLTIEQVRTLAVSSAPAAAAARARVEIVRGELLGAALWQPFNPEVELAAGPRSTVGRSTTDLELRVSQSVELGGRRAARVSAATATVDAARAVADDTTRHLVHAASAAFLRVLHLEQVRQSTAARQRVLDELVAVATERLRAGDVGILDVNVATVMQAEARASDQRVAASGALAVGELRAALGFAPDDVIVAEGDLSARPKYDLGTLLETANKRADLRALEHAVEQARAHVLLGFAERWPDLALSADYAREETADVFRVGVGLTLPLSSRGQATRAIGAAQAQAATLECVALQRTIAAQVSAAFTAYQLLDAAALSFAQDALSPLAENLDFIRRSYAAGNVAISDVLVMQRELVDAQRSYLDLLLEARLMALDLETSAGWNL